MGEEIGGVVLAVADGDESGFGLAVSGAGDGACVEVHHFS